MTQSPKRVTLFAAWATRYDRAVAAGEPSFPFAGYDEVLAATVRLAGARPASRILDLGIGTGNLAAHFVAAGCQVWGLDFSAPMLAQARERLPQVHLIQADLLAEWPIAARPLFDRIVTAYVLVVADLSAGFLVCRGVDGAGGERPFAPTQVDHRGTCKRD